VKEKTGSYTKHNRRGTCSITPQCTDHQMTAAVQLSESQLNDIAHCVHTSELQDITTILDHSVTWHPTEVNVPRLTPARKAVSQLTYPGGMKGW